MPHQYSDNTKQSTSAKALRFIYRNAPVSRVSIAENLLLSPAMVTNVIASLSEQGYVRELGVIKDAAQSGVPLGRKRSLLGPCTDIKYGIGINMAHASHQLCITDLTGNVILMREFSPQRRDGIFNTKDILKNIRSLLDESGVPLDKFIGIGVSVPGHFTNGRIISHSREMSLVDLVHIEKEIGLPVVCENNVRAMAYGEFIFNHVNCPDDFAFVHVGAGIFCARFSESHLSTDSALVSGELGHTTANLDGPPCGCGKFGCLQLYSSETAIIHKAQTLYKSGAHTLLRDMVNSADEINSDTVLSAYEYGDELVVRLISDAIRYLSAAVANLSVLIGPKKIYLHGKLFQTSSIRRITQSQIESQLQFVSSTEIQKLEILPYSAHRAAIGASAMAIDCLFIQKIQ